MFNTYCSSTVMKGAAPSTPLSTCLSGIRFSNTPNYKKVSQQCEDIIAFHVFHGHFNISKWPCFQKPFSLLFLLTNNANVTLPIMTWKQSNATYFSLLGEGQICFLFQTVADYRLNEYFNGKLNRRSSNKRMDYSERVCIA